MVPYRIVRVVPGDAHWPSIQKMFPGTMRYMTDVTDTGDYRFFAAVGGTDPTILGGVVIDIGVVRLGPCARDRCGFLENIEVLTPWRRRGIGTALMQAALAHAWSEGARHVRWTVSYDNEPGIGLYRSLGLALAPEEDPTTQQGREDRYYLVVAVPPTAAYLGAVTCHRATDAGQQGGRHDQDDSR